MNEDTIRDIYYVEHKWNPHFFYLSPKSFCQDLEKNGSGYPPITVTNAGKSWWQRKCPMSARSVDVRI